MAALRWALGHPANRGRELTTVLRWLAHQLRKRMSPGAPVSVSVGPARLEGPPRHPVICLARYVEGGLWDVEAFAVYAALLRPGDVFVDVGANIGGHAVVAAALVGREGRVVACEPDPASRAWLERNLARGPAPYHVETRPLADRPRRLGWAPVGPTLSHLDLASDPQVETTTLDAVLSRLGAEPGRTVVRVDVEGWEAAVLVGGRDTLREVRAVWIEALGLEHRCDVAWESAVELCRAQGLRFWVVDARGDGVAEAVSPDPRSATGHYLIARPRVAERVGESLRRLTARAAGELVARRAWR